jgi:ATP-dependent DNA helicase RecQ
MLLELLPPSADATERIEELIDRYATIQMQRVDEIATYAATLRCRHGHISSYLSGQPMMACQACDNCRPGSKSVTTVALPSEGEQLQTILRCVDTAPWSWGSFSLRKILRGDPNAPEKGRKSSEWGALAFRSDAAVEKLMDRLVDADLLCPRELSHGGVVLDLTPTGRDALKDPARLPSTPPKTRERPKPEPEQIGPVDKALFERLRAWRLETAKAAGVPPFVVAHDSLLKSLAAARPQSEGELTAIKGIGPKRLAQYGPAILALVAKDE